MATLANLYVSNREEKKNAATAVASGIHWIKFMTLRGGKKVDIRSPRYEWISNSQNECISWNTDVPSTHPLDWSHSKRQILNKQKIKKIKVIYGLNTPYIDYGPTFHILIHVQTLLRLLLAVVEDKKNMLFHKYT